MNINELLDFLDESIHDGLSHESSPLILLIRNIQVPIDSEHVWFKKKVVDVEVMEDGVDLIAASSEEQKHIALSELISKLKSFLPECDQFEVFVCGDYESVPGHDDWQSRKVSPILTVIQNQDQKMIGVMPWYKGCESELGS